MMRLGKDDEGLDTPPFPTSFLTIRIVPQSWEIIHSTTSIGHGSKTPINTRSDRGRAEDKKGSIFPIFPEWVFFRTCHPVSAPEISSELLSNKRLNRMSHRVAVGWWQSTRNPASLFNGDVQVI
ncbi:hypothetical protein JTE90_020006 [Oedothorax gibbosus]|uniref:Uncharacterized protein n=1 Tax=Oedothorax gibbosus TaxID=931172 RepID=A0AAV6UMK8_9ARAC|nr:hypothetical protein JTE90_020006 [Oedothorax gibbosus]